MCWLWGIEMALKRKDITSAAIAADEITKCMCSENSGEGVFGNCRWIYYPHLLTVGIASNSNFDRWANSRVISITPIMLDSGDPSLLDILTGIESIFNAT